MIITFSKSNLKMIISFIMQKIIMNLTRYVEIKSTEIDKIQTSETSDRRSIHPTITPVNQLSDYSRHHERIHSIDHSAIQPVCQPLNNWFPLSPRQGRILVFLTDESANVSNANIIASSTGIPLGTVKDALRELVKDGYIIHKKRVVIHKFRGFEYVLDRQKCLDYVARVRNLCHPANHHYDHLITSHLSISSNSYMNLSTNGVTSDHQNPINLDDPELAYWVGHGFNEKKAREWMEEFGLSVDQLSLSLKYARFDYLQRDIQRPLGYVYGTLKKSGFVPRPANYKSLLEIRLEKERGELADLEHQRRELEIVQEKKRSLQVELKLNQIMRVPEGDEYKDLLQRLPEIVRGSKGPLLYNSLKELIYEDLFGETIKF